MDVNKNSIKANYLATKIYGYFFEQLQEDNLKDAFLIGSQSLATICAWFVDAIIKDDSKHAKLALLNDIKEYAIKILELEILENKSH